MGFSVNMSFGPMKDNFKAFPEMTSTALIFAITITKIVVRSHNFVYELDDLWT